MRITSFVLATSIQLLANCCSVLALYDGRTTNIARIRHFGNPPEAQKPHELSPRGCNKPLVFKFREAPILVKLSTVVNGRSGSLLSKICGDAVKM
jgi:hypothetical protein